MKKDKKPMSFDELCKKVKSGVVAGIFIFVLIILSILALAGGLAVILLMKSDSAVYFGWFLLVIFMLSFVAIFPTVIAYAVIYKIALREYPGQSDYFNLDIYRFLEADEDHLIHGLDSLRLILAQQKSKQEPNIEIDMDRNKQDFDTII